MEPFGTFQPDPKTQQKIDWCHRLPANWFGKQLAQILRKQVLSKCQLPLDLTFDQVKLRCHLTDNVSERGYVFMPWRWDSVERKVLLELLPADGVFIDIGANVGIYSAVASTVLNKLAVIVSIEPNPEVYARMKFNLTATIEAFPNQPRVEMLQLGISDQSGEFNLYLDQQNLGASSLLEKSHQASHIVIPCEPLLKVIKAQKLSRVDVIKCDIEGAEDQALVPFFLEAPNHLLPACLIVENNSHQWQADCFEVLAQRGYSRTHETRLNLIYQLRQPIERTSQNSKFKATVPVAT